MQLLCQLRPLFGASLSASLACQTSRRLSGFCICCPYHSILAPYCIDACSYTVFSRFQCQSCGCGFIVPGASYHCVATIACPGRILLVKQEVSWQFPLLRQTFRRLRVAHIHCLRSSRWSRE